MLVMGWAHMFTTLIFYYLFYKGFEIFEPISITLSPVHSGRARKEAWGGHDMKFI